MSNVIAEKSLYFEWSTIELADPAVGLADPAVDYVLFDETLRDGIQAPYVEIPSIEAKLRLLDHMMSAGITAVDAGFPGAGTRAYRDCLAITEYVLAQRCSIRLAFAGRTHPGDVGAICEIAQQAQCDVDAYSFVGISPVRQVVEDWSFDLIERRVIASARQCRQAGVNFVLVLEDATRCTPCTLSRIYDTAVELGVERITLCDTVGVATPASTRAQVRWSLEHFRRRAHSIALDWHGHNDRGLALINSLVALEAGCDRIHGTVLGIGERAGNTAIDQLILNRHLQYGDDFDLQSLRQYCEYASAVLGMSIPVNYPALGSHVFTTSAGVHAAAILKARQTGDDDLLDGVYSSVPARILGRRQEVLVDGSSGASNVKFWLIEHGYEPEPRLINRVLEAAKSTNRPLTVKQIVNLIDSRH
jgi:2-isopropylmalate synthase